LLQHALQEARLSSDTAFEPRGSSQLHGAVLSVIVLGPGTQHDSEFTAYDEEERLIWLTLGGVGDVFSTRILACARSVDCIKAEFDTLGFHLDARQSRGFLAKLSHVCANSVLAGNFVSPRGDVKSGAAWLRHWGNQVQGAANNSLRCMVVTLPVALAASAGHWHKLMFQATPIRFRPRLFAHFPCPAFWNALPQLRQWIAYTELQVAGPDGPNVEIQLRELAQRLRRWAPHVLEQTRDEEHMVETRLELTSVCGRFDFHPFNLGYYFAALQCSQVD
jgi:hypothetical protein